MTAIPQTLQPPDEQDALPGVSFNVEALLARGMEILRREVANLLAESSGKKLSPTSARDLVNYVKLLSELKATQAKELSEMTDEQLEALSAKELDHSNTK